MKRPLIAAHRGASGGNIHCNTSIAFEAALTQGADIIELDVTKSADGVLFVFHPGKEKEHLRCETSLSQMTAQEIGALRYVNIDNDFTQQPVSRLDDVLEQLKNRCIVNLDKFPTCMEDIAKAVRRHGMADQVIVKTDAKAEWFEKVEQIAPDLPYMVFARGTDDFSERLMTRPMRYTGTEIIFPDDLCQVAQPAYFERMHALNLKVWANAIVFDYRRVLAAGHNDDISVAGRPDEGWGRLIDLNADMIQTDWPGMLRDYMQRREGGGV